MARLFTPKLLDWYLISQLVPVVLFALIVFTIIWLAPETLFKLTQWVFAGQLTLAQALRMALYHVPDVLQQTFPIALLLGSIFVFQRLSRDYEWVAMLAAGVPPVRALASVLLVGLLFAGAHWAVQETVLPQTTPRLEGMYTHFGLKTRPDRNFLFVEKNHHHRLNKFFMIGQVGQNRLSDFLILYYDETPSDGVRIARILRADTGYWMPNAHQWQLLHGLEYVLNREGVYKEIRRFDEQQVRTDRYAAILLDYTRMNPLVLPWRQLQQYIRVLKAGGQRQDVPYFEVHLHQKQAAPVATMIFAVLGALLGMEHVRSRQVYGLTFGALVIFLYTVLVPLTGNFGALDLSAPWLVAWIPLLAVLLLTSGMLIYRSRQV